MELFLGSRVAHSEMTFPGTLDSYNALNLMKNEAVVTFTLIFVLHILEAFAEEDSTVTSTPLVARIDRNDIKGRRS